MKALVLFFLCLFLPVAAAEPFARTIKVAHYWQLPVANFLNKHPTATDAKPWGMLELDGVWFEFDKKGRVDTVHVPALGRNDRECAAFIRNTIGHPTFDLTSPTRQGTSIRTWEDAGMCKMVQIRNGGDGRPESMWFLMKPNPIVEAMAPQ